MAHFTNTASHAELSHVRDESSCIQDTKRPEKDVYWSYDPELRTVVMRRMSSYETKQTDSKVPAAEPEPATPVHPSTQVDQADITAADSSFSEDSTLIDPIQSPGKTKLAGYDDSHHDDILGGLEAHPLENFDESLDSVDISLDSAPGFVLHGLGIMGLTNDDGTVFDGTGVVGLGGVPMRRSTGFGRCGFLRDPFAPQEEVSRTLIDEIKDTFASSPSSPHPHYRRERSSHDNPTFTAFPPPRPGLYAWLLDNIVQSNNNAQEEVGHVSGALEDTSISTGTRPRLQSSPVGLGIVGLTRGDGEAFDGTGIVGVRGRRSFQGEHEAVVSVTQTVIGEIAHTFSVPLTAAVSS